MTTENPPRIWFTPEFMHLILDTLQPPAQREIMALLEEAITRGVATGKLPDQPWHVGIKTTRSALSRELVKSTLPPRKRK